MALTAARLNRFTEFVIREVDRKDPSNNTKRENKVAETGSRLSSSTNLL